MLWSSAGLGRVGRRPKRAPGPQHNRGVGVVSTACFSALPSTVTFRSAVAFLLLAVLVGCDTTECESSGLDCPPVGPGGDTVVAGVNLDSLFAPPTGEEIAAVQAEWARPSDPDSATILREVTTLDLGGRETVRVVEGVSPEVSGPLFVAAVRQPPRVAGDARTRPLLLVLGDEPDADVSALLRNLAVRDDLKDEFVILFLAYRGGTLRVGGQSFSSAAAPSVYEGDAEDALALVTGLRALGGNVGIDLNRLAVVGHSRGGNVGLLMSARAKAQSRGVPQYVLSLAAPTSFFTQSVKETARGYLEVGSAGVIPGIRSVLDATAGRVRDGELTVREARLELLRRSAAPFFAPPRGSVPPFIFAAYAENDVFVPREDARALDFLTSQQGLYLELENVTHETIRSDGQVLSIGAAFLCRDVLSDTVAGCR